MSGGVDSSVAAVLMKEKGYDPIGVTMKLYDNEDINMSKEKTCCSLSDVEDARSVARALEMPYYVFNFSDRFKEEVMEKFVCSYENGCTPNPCIDCNRYLKFEKLFQRAKELSYDYVVTGHYAQIEYNEETGRYLLKKSVDLSKDQSYVLYSLTQDQLAHVQFPLGGMHKTEAREIAEAQGFINARKHDSQDICFVPDGDYAKFIEKYTGKKTPEGDFVDKEGRGYGAAFNLKADASDILIPVSDLVPTKAAMLPQDWPGVNPYWYPASAQENNGIALDWKIIDFVQVSLREELYNIGNQKNKGVVVERIDLLFQ